jgi:quercetin dioxygenase-like cupin family protein
MQDTTWVKAPSFEPIPRVKISIIGNGMHATMCHIVIKSGAVIDWHGHPQEQMGTLISGTGKLTSRNKTVEAEKGSAWYIPPNDEHKFQNTGEKPAVIIETFAPARVDYIIKAK